MKKTMQWLGVVVMASALWVRADVTIDWEADWLSDDVEVGSELQDGWVVGLYQDVNGDNTGSWYNDVLIDVSDGSVISSGATSDDIFLSVTRNLVDTGGGDITLNPIDNAAKLPDHSSVYSVIFNATSMGSATKMVVTGYREDPTSPFDIGTPQPTNTKYNLGSDIASSSFRAVPEPAVASLLSIFGVGIVSLRRFFRRHAA